MMTELSSDLWQEETSHSLLQNTRLYFIFFFLFIKATQILCLKSHSPAAEALHRKLGEKEQMDGGRGKKDLNLN